MTETGRFYSSIRRIPTTLYRLPDGTRVPGGPYTLVQGVGGAITVALLWAVRGSWTTGFDLLDFAGALAAGLAVTWLLRFAPDNLHELGLVILLGAVIFLIGSARGKWTVPAVLLSLLAAALFVWGGLQGVQWAADSAGATIK